MKSDAERVVVFTPVVANISLVSSTRMLLPAKDSCAYVKPPDKPILSPLEKSVMVSAPSPAAKTKISFMPGDADDQQRFQVIVQWREGAYRNFERLRDASTDTERAQVAAEIEASATATAAVLQ